jgi:hypothetical protein
MLNYDLRACLLYFLSPLRLLAFLLLLLPN